jgi:hypothetical protein
MNSYKPVLGGCFLILALALGTINTRAQDEPQEPPDTKPKPAARSLPPIDPGNPQDDFQNPNALQPDTTPLTGVQNATLGSPEMRHSYWVPGAAYATMIQSGGYGASNSSGWFVSNYLIGNVSLLKAWSRSELIVNYSGGGFFSSSSTLGSGWYQQLALSQSFQWNRWNVQLFDQFSYLPESAFGFGIGTSLGIPGAGGSAPVIPGMGNNYVPNQSIFASVGPRYSNAATIQVTYALSRRGSITASGTYGILRFVDPGNVDSSTPIGTIGYNYVLSPESTIGLLYSFSAFHYPGQPQAYGSQTISAAYGRKVTGRMALQLYGGPQITSFRVPIDGQTSKVGANINAGLTYGFENSMLGVTYNHLLTGGSGVYTGSIVDQVTFTATRKLSREWIANFNVGFAHNTALISSATTSSPNYNTWYAGAGANRPIGRNLNLAIAYSFSVSSTSQSACTTAPCNVSQTANSISLNLQWHARPMVLP